MLYIDLETRSRVDLKACGSYVYAEDESTEILCIGWGYWDLPTATKRTGVAISFRSLPDYVVDYIKNSNGLVAAFNANFDRVVWEALAPDEYQIPLNRWYCVAAQMRVNAMPGALNDAGRALTGKYIKDFRGSHLIRMLCIPQKDGTFNTNPTLLNELLEYCEQDIVATMTVADDTRTMTPAEHHDYLVNEQINDDGMKIDRRLATLAIDYAAQEAGEIAEKLRRLTDNEVTKHTQIQRIKNYLLPLLSSRAYKIAQSKGKYSFDKTARANLISGIEEGALDEEDPKTLEILKLLDDGNKSSVAKFQRMLDRADKYDDRVRGAFIYAGASQTLRYASRGLQLHNFRRDALDPDATAQLIDAMENDEVVNPVMETLSKALRPALIPEEGNVFVVGDWSQIEAGALPWLADDPRTEERLNILRNPDGDLYQNTTDKLGLIERQIGKVVELAFGFGGAVGAFQTMARAYKVNLPLKTIQGLVSVWRQENAWAVDFWNCLESAAKRAINHPLRHHTAGRVYYTFVPDLIGGTLVCTLPNGQMIQYPKAKLETQETPYGPKVVITALKANWKPAAGAKEWPRVTLWRGLLAENVTQATCAARLREALSDCVHDGLFVPADVHDEIVVETSNITGTQRAVQLQRIMEEEKPWASGLPLRAVPKIMTRYGK